MPFCTPKENIREDSPHISILRQEQRSLQYGGFLITKVQRPDGKMAVVKAAKKD
jgi:hypothetical protein